MCLYFCWAYTSEWNCSISFLSCFLLVCIPPAVTRILISLHCRLTNILCKGADSKYLDFVSYTASVTTTHAGAWSMEAVGGTREQVSVAALRHNVICKDSWWAVFGPRAMAYQPLLYILSNTWHCQPFYF